MNILVINGSPKGGNSNTYRLTSAFLDGMKQEIQNIQTKELSISRMNYNMDLSSVLFYGSRFIKKSY